VASGKGRDAAVACVRSYRKRLAEFSEMHPLDVWYARITAEDFLSQRQSSTDSSCLWGF
jgi:hypothetical protein